LLIRTAGELAGAKAAQRVKFCGTDLVALYNLQKQSAINAPVHALGNDLPDLPCVLETT
jgi:hypothetical protein